jgi:predicted AlkP superfamily pyrophosphatase or phosphodiesterase
MVAQPKKSFFLYIFALLFFQNFAQLTAQITPNIAVVFVIDQFAYHYLWKVRPFLKYGLKKLLDKGTVYHDATYPHGMPCTPTGHAALSTGTFGYVHGVPSYGWINQDNEYTLITDDNRPESFVFSKNGLHNYGQSARQLMTDTICDQFALTSEPSNPAYAYAFALKARSSIMLAGRKGKAFWFDEIDGGLTSSKAYFDSIPPWLIKVNRDLRPKDKAQYHWSYFHPRTSKAYNFSQARNYDFTVAGKAAAGQKFTIDASVKQPYEDFLASPFADNLVLAAARRCISQHLNVNEHRHARMLVFVSLSGFDFSGHLFGPDSVEQLDMLYHLDKQIGKFINSVQATAGRKKCLFALTADHGVMPIPEILNAKGFSLPQRIDGEELAQKLNAEAQRELGVKNIVKHFEAPVFFLDKKIMATLDKDKQDKLLEQLKGVIKSTDGIRDCWTLKDLETTESSIRNKYQVLFSKQVYRGRSGDLFCMTEPYKMLTKYPTGTSHASPYRYDTHVPLAFYQSGIHDTGLQVQQPVSMVQFATTLARLLNCPAPSCARGPILPGLYRF